ncbi:Transglutaminase-like superfamily protein [Jatrophihabitans endophyticus]|uniref:Transglutaminase-like superfamily protein n=1 Tax=Jatrophihabitans endophyticus TaxID=1206085 RepID=A0A1M5PCU2_9ACTN|nr:transglutaminase domain-containing protein [Jatrophihabitans endophyticus]SHG99586.1 Transglutaminase-like superfamily protein [Jatrophihabitans endophyticus]
MTDVRGGAEGGRHGPRQLSTDPRVDGDRRRSLGLRGLVDIAFVLVLTGVALYGLRSTFSGQQYLLAGLVAAVVGIALASTVTVLRLPVWTAALFVVVGYYLLAGVLVFRDDALGGVLPTAGVLRDATTVLADGWKQLLTTLPPVAGDGPLLAIPYVLGLLSGAIATSVAQRTRARLLPALAPVAALAAVILLGTAEPAARVWQGIVFGTVLVCWAAVRRPGARPLTPRLTPGGPQRLLIGAAVLAVAGVSAAVVQPHLAGGDRHRVVLRDYVKPPFDIAAYPSPLVGFRKYTKSANLLYDQTLFTVRGVPAGTPVRLATLDAYDGSVWGATNGTVGTAAGEPVDAFQRVGSRIDVPARGRGVTATVTVAAPYAAASDIDAWVPAPGTLRSITFHGTRADAHADAFRYNLATASGITAERLAAGDRYTVRAVVGTQQLPRDAEPAGAPTVDESAAAFVSSRATQWSAKAQGVRDQVVAAGRYMRDHGAYSDGGPGEAQYLPGHSAGRLTSFLNATQLVGDDEQYAAAFALIANELGMPARVVLQAEPQTGGVVRGKDVHAAVEVHVRTGGRTVWATIPRTSFMPDQNKKPNQQPPQTVQDAEAAVVPPPNPVHPPSTLDEPDRPDQNTQRLGRIPRDEGGVLSGWFGAVVLWVALPILVVALVCGVIVGAKWRRRTLRRTRGSVPDRFDAGWREFLDAARDFGAVVPGGRTRHEQAVALADRPAGERAGPLAAGADHGVFGPGEQPDDAVAAYWRQVDAARAAMAHDAGRLARTRAALTLRSFRSPRRPARDTPPARAARSRVAT